MRITTCRHGETRVPVGDRNVNNWCGICNDWFAPGPASRFAEALTTYFETGWIMEDPRGSEYGHYLARENGNTLLVSFLPWEDGECFTIVFTTPRDFQAWARSVFGGPAERGES